MSALITDPRRLRLPILPESQSPLAAGGASQRGSHRLAEIAGCRRQWFFHQVWKIVSHVRPKYFVEGELCHLQLAYFFAERMRQLSLAPPRWLDAQPLGEALTEAGRGYPELIPMSYDFIRAYALAAHGDRWTPVGVEPEFAATIGGMRRLVLGPDAPSTPEDEQTVTARIDLVALANGMLWLVDHKSTGRVSKSGVLFAWNDTGEFAIRWQFYVQLLVVRTALMQQAEATGDGPPPDVGGVVVQRFARVPPFDVDANPTPFNAQVYRDAVSTIQAQVRAESEAIAEVQAAQARGEDMETWLPTPSLWSCFSWGKPCDYRSLCLTDRGDKGAWRSVLSTEYRSTT